ncbi:MAG: hypothetical protein OSB09_06925 [Planctomycetota bacterium]|nr:hypothetical protein [Planctomycetota bacterium]
MDLISFSLMVGIVQLLLGLPMLLQPDRVDRWFRVISEDDLWLRSLGYLWLVSAVLVLFENATVGTDVAGLIRLLAWATAIKSLILCWWPKPLIRLRQQIYGVAVRRWMGLAPTVVGLLCLAAAIHLKEM